MQTVTNGDLPGSHSSPRWLQEPTQALSLMQTCEMSGKTALKGSTGTDYEGQRCTLCLWVPTCLGFGRRGWQRVLPLEPTAPFAGARATPPFPASGEVMVVGALVLVYSTQEVQPPGWGARELRRQCNAGQVTTPPTDPDLPATQPWGSSGHWRV